MAKPASYCCQLADSEGVIEGTLFSSAYLIHCVISMNSCWQPADNQLFMCKSGFWVKRTERVASFPKMQYLPSAVSTEMCIFALSVIDFSLCGCYLLAHIGVCRKKYLSFHSEGIQKYLPLTLPIAELVFPSIKLHCGCSSNIWGVSVQPKNKRNTKVTAKILKKKPLLMLWHRACGHFLDSHISCFTVR